AGSRARGRGRLANLLVATVLAVLAALFGAGGQGLGAGKRPVIVGYMVPLTGSTAANGQNAASGFNLGLKVFGSTVAGHKIHVDYVDTQGDPAVAVTQARALVEHDRADVIEGPLIAAEVGPVASYLG